MISFDFEYIQPDSIEKAIEAYTNAKSTDKKVMYISGGTEFISRARADEIQVDVVIDLKYIPACNVLEVMEGELMIGTAKTLTDVATSNFFPLLTSVIRSIATRTERNKISIGGNLMSNLPYKEAILPFLLAESKLIIATKKGLQQMSITEVFSKEIKITKEQFIVQIVTDLKMMDMPFFTEKKTKHSKINYPIITLAALKVNEELRVACSGLLEYPFRLLELERQLNDKEPLVDKRMKKMMRSLPNSVLDDMYASATYREFVFETTFIKMMEQMEA